MTNHVEEVRAMINWLELTRDAGVVGRYHTQRTIRPQNVGEHSYHVANLVLIITMGDCSASLLKAALHHDLPELYTGDIPAPFKVENPDLRVAIRELEAAFAQNAGVDHELTDEEVAVLKWADGLELLFYCIEERKLGNTHIAEVFERGLAYLDAMPPAEPNAMYLRNHCAAEWRTLNAKD